MKMVSSLSFQGQCRRAFDFYAKVLGGKITAAMTYGDAPPGMSITETFWPPGFGSLVDKFGVPWIINVVPSANWQPKQD
jgi:uncharacterized glyoxalase superfamily protein PhnB